jgi:tetratricopeptide (TPR) repeat protein
MRRRGLALCFGVLCLLVPSLLIAGEPQWVEVRSENFTVITDDGEKSGRHIAELFEQMRAAFGVVFVRPRIHQSVPLQIIAFRDTKELRDYSPIFQGKVVQLAGFFQMSEDKNFILVDLSSQNNWQIVFHEYAHLWLEGNFPQSAPWFDEGFAEYLSTMQIHHGTVQVGQPVPAAALLNQATKFSLLDLFRVQHHSETYNQNGERRDMFYVESWLVAHYLMDSLQFSKTAEYFRLTNQKKTPIPEAVQTAFGISLPEMEKRIWTGWHSGRFAVRDYDYKDKIPTTFNLTAKPMDSLAARVELADVHAHSQDYQQKAIQELEQIVQQNPNLAGAQRSLGYAYLRRGDTTRAQEHFRAAAKLGSTDARTYYFAAVLMNQASPGAAGSEEYVDHLQRALQLDPQYADAYHMLALGQVRQHQYAEAERNLRRAVELSPRNEVYQLNLAAVLLNQGKNEEGKTLVTTLSQSSNPMVAENAGQMLSAMNAGPMTPPDDSNPPAPGSGPESRPASAMPQTTDKRPMAFLSGKIVSVDCTAAPAAELTVLSSGKTYRLHVADRDRLVLINADKFSCQWKGVGASANYRDSGGLQGEVISLELQ